MSLIKNKTTQVKCIIFVQGILILKDSLHL